MQIQARTRAAAAIGVTWLAALLSGAEATGQVSVLTNRYDNFGTGANTQETLLNPRSVGADQFGKLYSYKVDGSVFAQPLYVPGVKTKAGVRNVLYVATMNDKVYAFDADAAVEALWTRDFASGAGVTPVPVSDITGSDDLNIVGNVGILGTPVIDRAANAIYFVTRTKENGAYVQTLRALDIRSGEDAVKPVVIQARVKGTAKDAVGGSLQFNPKTESQRPAIALTRGTLLIAWASHEDIGPYHGWIMAYDAKHLKQIAVFCTTPNGDMGGIWQSGRAPVVDAEGYIYYEVGNGDFDGKTEFGESLLKLRIAKNKLIVSDSYTPENYPELNQKDADFGSTGPLLIPGTNIILTGEKYGNLTLLNTKDLGRVTANDQQRYQVVHVGGGRVLAGPAWWQSASGARLYIWDEADFLKMFTFEGKGLSDTPIAKGAIASHGSPGGALTISADGGKAGTAILWAMLTINKSADHGNAPGVLYAYDAETLAPLWSSETNSERDRLGTLVKFVPPTVAAGKVYAVTYDGQVNVYGLLNPAH